jgi:hypothetical protein
MFQTITVTLTGSRRFDSQIGRIPFCFLPLHVLLVFGFVRLNNLLRRSFADYRIGKFRRAKKREKRKATV